jgi:hypothetical protein
LTEDASKLPEADESDWASAHGRTAESKTSLRILEKVSEPENHLGLRNGLFLIASADDMVNGAGEMDARFPTHEPPLSNTEPKANNQSLTPSFWRLD